MNEPLLLPADHQQRLDALDPLRCVCVTAPAGAGKTELLSQRVLTLLANAEQPEDILAITFTRKAAAEMHHRIIQALCRAQEEEPLEEHKRLSWRLAKKALERDRLQNWQLLANPSRLRIQTIDSLCANLTKQMPILANFGAQPKIASNAQTYYRMAVHNLLQQLESDSNIALDVMNLLAHVDNDMAKVERLLMSLIAQRDQWMLHIGIGVDIESAQTLLEQTLQQINYDLIKVLSQRLTPIAVDLLPLLDYAATNLLNEKIHSNVTLLAGITQLPPIDCSAIAQWNAIVDILLTKTGEWRKSVDKRTGFPTETVSTDKKQAKQLKNALLEIVGELSGDNDLLSNLQELRYLPTTRYDTQQWQMLASLTRLLPTLVAELTLVFQQRGEVDYSQMTLAALRALGDGLTPTDLALKLDHRLRHILIDEFQDTASTQYILLERLVEGWHEHNTNNRQQPNTLFIVGDGMQSIYGFREANVGLFLGARKNGVNGLQLHDLPLTVNFRSSPTIVNWVNKTFSQAFPQKENLSRGAVPFEHAHAFKPENETSAVQVLGFIGDQSRIDEAEKTLEIVQQQLQENASASIAILVRSRTHLLEIIPALSRAGIAWSATDIDPLANVSAIIDLLSLTKALLNIADQISWAALLRTPWIGLNNQDLHIMLANFTDSGDTSKRIHPQSVWAALFNNTHNEKLSSHAKQRLPVIQTIFENAYKNRQRLATRSWVEGVWLQLGGASSLSCRELLTAVDDYFDLLEQFQQGDKLTAFDEFEQAVQSLYAAPSSSDNRLQVMTIHKAKGLEFDTVILPGMARIARSDDKSLLMWREYTSPDSSTQQKNKTGLVLSPLGASGNEEDKIYQHLRYEQAQSSALENTRLFYVAATRAVKSLYILFEAQQNSKDETIKPPAKNSLLYSAWDALKDTAIWHNNKTTVTGGQIGLDFESGDNNPVSLLRLDAGWQQPKWSFINPLEEYYLDADDLPQNNNNIMNRPEPLDDQYSRCVGTVVHRILEQLVCNSTQFWLEMSNDNRAQWLAHLLKQTAVTKQQTTQAIIDISRAINNTISDKKGAWILSNTHAQSVCEWELLACFPAAVKQRVIDRSFVDQDGVRWIIDYKTSQPYQGESRDAFIERESQHYRSQLIEYASYLSMMSHQQGQAQTIKTALYFTFLPHLQELSI